MASRAVEIMDKIKEQSKQVIVDNDFEAAYNMPLVAYKDYRNDELVEALFILQAIIEEMSDTQES